MRSNMSQVKGKHKVTRSTAGTSKKVGRELWGLVNNRPNVEVKSKGWVHQDTKILVGMYKRYGVSKSEYSDRVPVSCQATEPHWKRKATHLSLLMSKPHKEATQQILSISLWQEDVPKANDKGEDRQNLDRSYDHPQIFCNCSEWLEADDLHTLRIVEAPAPNLTALHWWHPDNYCWRPTLTQQTRT